MAIKPSANLMLLPFTRREHTETAKDVGEEDAGKRVFSCERGAFRDRRMLQESSEEGDEASVVSALVSLFATFNQLGFYGR